MCVSVEGEVSTSHTHTLSRTREHTLGDNVRVCGRGGVTECAFVRGGRCDRICVCVEWGVSQSICLYVRL